MNYFKQLLPTFLLFIFTGFSAVIADSATDKFSQIEIKSIKLGHGIYICLWGQGGI
jgi:hypothetical protein